MDIQIVQDDVPLRRFGVACHQALELPLAWASPSLYAFVVIAGVTTIIQSVEAIGACL
jgi:hypothetical protein